MISTSTGPFIFPKTRAGFPARARSACSRIRDRSLGASSFGRATVPESPEHALAELERRAGGRLGIAVLDTTTGKHLEHRAGERFALCSTFKLVAAAAVLRRVERSEDQLSRFVPYTERDSARVRSRDPRAPLRGRHAARPPALPRTQPRRL